jgi:hypothetical protein
VTPLFQPSSSASGGHETHVRFLPSASASDEAEWLGTLLLGTTSNCDANGRGRANEPTNRAVQRSVGWRERLWSVKEDVLEQIVDDYLKFSGYFTTHNVGFRPRAGHPDFVKNQDSVYSDVDVVGYHPAKVGVARVIAVNCKAWQAGFNATAKLAELREEKRNPKRATWRHFRELWIPKWSEAFRDRIEELTGQRDFAYRVAVTRPGRHRGLGRGPDYCGEPRRMRCRIPSAGAHVERHVDPADHDACR